MKDNSIDYVKALKRPFLNTKSVLVGTLLGIIPVVNFTVIGYTLASTGLSKEQVGKDTLPEWNDYVELFKKGLEIDPNMIKEPRANPYVRMDGWDEEASKWFERKQAAA